MEKPRGRILLMPWSDIFCLTLKGKLMLTVKSISNQDWNLLYDHGQWTPYYWSHKWCHISAVLWLTIFSPEIPILIKNVNLKAKCHLLTVKSVPLCFSCALEALCGAEDSLHPSQHHPVPLAKTCLKTNLQFTLWKQVRCESWEEHRSWAGLWGWRNVTTCEQHDPKVPCAVQTQLPWD